MQCRCWLCICKSKFFHIISVIELRHVTNKFRFFKDLYKKFFLLFLWRGKCWGNKLLTNQTHSGYLLFALCPNWLIWVRKKKFLHQSHKTWITQNLNVYAFLIIYEYEGMNRFIVIYWLDLPLESWIFLLFTNSIYNRTVLLCLASSTFIEMFQYSTTPNMPHNNKQRLHRGKSTKITFL